MPPISHTVSGNPGALADKTRPPILSLISNIPILRLPRSAIQFWSCSEDSAPSKSILHAVYNPPAPPPITATS